MTRKLRSGRQIRCPGDAVFDKINNDRISFSDLSAEIRNRIYTYALTEDFKTPDNRIIIRRSANKLTSKSGISPNILRTCQACYNEANSILYGFNTFELGLYADWMFLTGLRKGSRQGLRAVQVSASGANDLLQTPRLLKDAKQLQSFVVSDLASRDHYRFAEFIAEQPIPRERETRELLVERHYNWAADMADELEPLMKAVRKVRGTSEDFMKMLQFKPGEDLTGSPDGHSMWHSYVEKVREILEERLS